MRPSSPRDPAKRATARCSGTPAKILSRHPGVPFTPQTARKHSQLPPATDSIVLIVDPGTARQQNHLRSDAMLRLIDHIGGFWRVASWLRIIPRPLRDSIYDAVAKHRYRWFGKFDVCRIPPEKFRDRFLP